MEENEISDGKYNTEINVLGGLRDYSVILKAFDSYFSQLDTLNDLIKKRNEFNLRTEKSQSRIEYSVNKTFLKFYSQEHQDLLQSVFKEIVPQKDKELVLIWQFALNNRLFRDITVNVFMKTYYSGRATISKDDIIAYIKELLLQKEEPKLNWSEKTINTLSTKYLNVMSKLGFLSIGRIKSFIHIRPSAEALVVFLYFSKIISPSISNVLVNELLLLSYIPAEDFQDRLKKLSIKGYFNMNFNGIALNIELTHSYKGICDVLYN